MGAWSLYFLAKLGLYYGHGIGLHWLLNLLLAAALAWPLQRPAWRRARAVLALPAAVALLYADSYLPPPAQLFDRAGALGDFRAGYLLELAQRALPLPALLAAALMVLLYFLLQHRLRFATLAFAGLLSAAVLPPAPAAPAAPADARANGPEDAADAPEAAADSAAPLSAARLDAALQAYYDSQRGKAVSFARAGAARFDLVLLNICSLSRDDLDFEHAQDAPLLARFDIVFTRFNSAATYSGPAVLRLLHGTCGQAPQAALYSGTAADSCYLFRNLADAGYEPALLLNHDGRFGHFAQELRDSGGVGAEPLDNRAAPVAMQAFDGSPVRSDFALLSQWWQRGAGADAHRALLYNTITLHDGNRLPGAGGGDSRASYAPRLRTLLADLGRFLDLVEASGRPTVVVLIPEHGAALRGDAAQVPGLRELPTRAITQVPVAVKLIGLEGVGHGGPPLRVDRPASYLSLTTLIAGLNAVDGAAGGRSGLEHLLRALPATQWVAENEGTVLFHAGGRDYLRTPAGEWSELGAPPG